MCQMEIMIICHPLSNQVLLARNILCTIGYLLFITNVVLSAEGQTQRLANVSCGSSNCLAIYSSLTVTITPAAAPAA